MRATRPILVTAGLGIALLGATLSTSAAAAPTAAHPAPALHAARAAAPPSTQGVAASGAPIARPRKRPRTKAIMPLRHSAGLTHGAMTAPMTFHGGHLMTAPAHVYVIWYGEWSGKAAVPILSDLLRGLGTSAYASTNATFTDRAGHHVSNDITLAASITVAAKHAARLSDAGVKAVVRRAVTGGHLPSDTDGIYVVLTSADVRETSGFGSRYCGWHSHATIAAADLKFAFVGDPTTQAPRGCAAPSSLAQTPNGDSGADAMASTLVHEIDETLTDPDLTGWYDRYFNENGDKCAWTYGQTYSASGGGVANMRLRGRDFLIQRNWIVGSTQGCALTA